MSKYLTSSNKNLKKYYLIAGEASGDLHGGNLIKALKNKNPHTDCRCWGGDYMQAAGGTLVKHIKDLAFMGFWEVAQNIRTILGNFKLCKQDILEYQPDALILIDYPGFNLKIAAWAKEQGFQVFYYISPQIWAWKENRIHQIKKSVDQMFVILPFEKDYYKKHDFEVTYVGHPLLDVTTSFIPSPDFITRNNLSDKPIIAILPGSRKQEVERMLPTMISVQQDFPDYQFVIAGAPALPLSYYHEIIKRKDISIIQNDTYSLLSHADAALVASGTATLETALFKVPQIVCYKGSYITYRIAKTFVKIKYLSLVNLILDQPLVKELIQQECTPENIQLSLSELLQKENSAALRKAYNQLIQLLGNKGAAERVAAEILNF